MPRRRAKILAWTLSVGFHAALGLVLFQDDPGRVRTLPPWEPMTRDDSAGEESSSAMALERTVEPSALKPMAIASPTGQRPAEPIRPNPISPELSNLVRELASRPPPRDEVQDVTPIDFRTPVVEPHTGSSRPVEVAEPGFGKGRPLHGELPAGKSVVYILDRSTSMGLTRETFGAARAALLASVQALPNDCRYQALAYNGQVTRLFPGRDLLKKSHEQNAALLAALGDLKPEGDSQHEVALRAALALHADYLVFITDADEDELAALKPILKGHPKPVAVSIVRVTAGKVGEAKAFR